MATTEVGSDFDTSIIEETLSFEELRHRGFKPLSAIGAYQEAHPIIEPLNLPLRLAVQLETAQDFHNLPALEHAEDANETLMMWAQLFAELFREVCDRHRVPPQVFEDRFELFQEEVGPHIARLKWLLSERRGDVGIDGIKKHILWRVESLIKEDTTGQMGVLLAMGFQHTKDGLPIDAYSLEDAFFAYLETKSLPSVEETV